MIDWDYLKDSDLDKPLNKVVCPECNELVSKDELDMFGGLCEECSGAFD